MVTHFLSSSTDGKRIWVVEQTKHPQNVARAFTSDFLILELATPSEYPPIPRTLRGWLGLCRWWHHVERSQSRELLKMDVSIMSNAVCAPAVRSVGVVNTALMCAGGVRNHDSCQSDSI